MTKNIFVTVKVASCKDGFIDSSSCIFLHLSRNYICQSILNYVTIWSCVRKRPASKLICNLKEIRH